MSKQTDLINIPDAITVSGSNVGIGTSSPTFTSAYGGLHIHSTYPELHLTGTDSGSGASDGFRINKNSANHVYLWNYENANIVFATNNSERMRITSSGNVGIGTSSISSSDKLSVVGGKIRASQSIAQSGNSLDNATYSGITINNSNDANGDLAGIAMYPTSQYTAAAGLFGVRESQTAAALSFWTGSNTGAERMRIDSSGNVGIGSTTPSSNLEIRNGSAPATFRLVHSGNGTFTATTTNGLTTLNAADVGASLVLSTANSERMRIDSSGIDVTGTVEANDLIVGSASDSQSLIQMIANPTNGANTIHFGDAATGTAAYDGYINYAHDSKTMQFQVAGSESMRILHDDGTGDGAVKIKGGLGLNFSSSSDSSQVMLAVGTDNSYRSGVIFELTTSQGLWACGFIKIKCAAGRNGLESRSAAEYLYKFQAFNEGISGISLVSSAGNTGDFTISVTEANANSSTGTVELKVKSTAATNHGSSVTYAEVGHFNGISRVRRGI